jgi:hypothetical protein
MKRALAVLAAAIAVGGCVTVVPVPARPVPPSTSAPDSARRRKPPPVVVIADPQDSSRARRGGWREHRADTVVEVAGTDGKTDHRPGWAARPHEGGPTEPPPGLAKHDSMPPGQARKDAKPDKPEHGPPDKEGRPDVGHGVLAHPVAPGHEEKADHEARGEPGKSDAAHGNKGAEAGNKGAEPGHKGAEPGKNGVERGNNDVEPGDKAAGSGNHKGSQPGEKIVEPGSKGVDHGDKGAEPGKNAVEPGNKATDSGNHKGSQPGEKIVEPGGKGVDHGDKGAEPGKNAVEPGNKATDSGNHKGSQPGEKIVEPGNRHVEPETKSAAPAKKIVEPANRGAESGAKALEPDNRVKPGQAKQGGERPAQATQGSQEQTARASSTGVTTASIAQLLGSDALVGQRVQVTGTCLATKNQSAAGVAPGGGDGWQLGSGGTAIWVTGPRPEGCSPAAGGRAPVTVIAKVAEDQIPGHGKKSGETRRYLVIG